MRRQFGAVALATAALLMLGAVSAASAQAEVASAVQTEDPPAPVGDGDGTDAAAIDAAQGAAVNRELAFIRGDLQAGDMLGFRPSLYRGRWFKPGKEDVRRCIIERESNANYRATNGT